MAKKGATAALQTEVNTDEDWEKVLERRGLLVVDVYSDWSGPCTGMVSTLRKIKMEVGGDTISYAIAKNDCIAALERFRGKSEPVWMFIQNGAMVNLMFGAHCPNLQRLLIEEIRRMQHAEPPKWQTSVTARGPEEQQRWEKAEEIRLAKEAVRAAKEDAEKKAKYEAMLSQMMLELCEETALLLFPWIFKDEDGSPKDKENCPAYTELVHDLLEQCFDVVEEVRLVLDEDTIDKMFVESSYAITEDISYGLMEGKCMILRLRGKPSHPEWQVPNPVESPEDAEGDTCPIREINDVENYLLKIIHDKPPPLLPTTSGISSVARQSFSEPYSARFVHVHEADPDVEDDVERVYPGVWAPPQARSKVHVFKTIFPQYMEKAHPYEEKPPPPPLVCLRFDSSRFKDIAEAYSNFHDAVEYFGAFERDQPPGARRIASFPEDFETKVKYKTGCEIFVVVIRKVHEDVFLAFAGIEPYYVSESPEEAEEQVELYFPKGKVDELPEEPDSEDIAEGDEDEVDEEEEQEEEGEDEEGGMLDLSAFQRMY